MADLEQHVLVFERELGRPEDVACAVVEPGPDGDRYGVAIAPGLDRFTYELVLDWVTRVCRTMALHGPEPDGWQMENGVWRLWADLTPLPPLG